MSAEEKEIFTDMLCRVCGTKWNSKLAKRCPICEHGTGRAVNHIEDEIRRLRAQIAESNSQLQMAITLRDKIDRPFA